MTERESAEQQPESVYPVLVWAKESGVNIRDNTDFGTIVGKTVADQQFDQVGPSENGARYEATCGVDYGSDLWTPVSYDGYIRFIPTSCGYYKDELAE